MFVARSAARIRLARLVFLLVGLVPAVGLVAWAVHLRSDAHRAAIERRWQEVIGIPLRIGAVEHPRPGVIRGRDCLIPGATGRPDIRLPLVEIESSADEDRIRLGRFSCDPAAAVMLVELGRGWLTDEVRFRRTCIVEVADFAWPPPAPSAGEPPSQAVRLRIELVARPGTRALRMVRQSASHEDEVRIVRGPPAESPAETLAADTRRGGPPSPAPSVTITADCEEPVPLAAVVVAAGGGLEAAAACGSATVAGRLDATWSPNGWSGSAAGHIDGVDLATAAEAVGGRASGLASVDVARLAWTGGRVTDALLECAASEGTVDGRLFDRIVLALAARPGAAVRPLPPGGERRFDAAACILAVGPHGVQVLPATRQPTGLAVLGGEVLVAFPQASVPADRIAWMLSAPGTTYAPALGPGAWLISVLPGGDAPGPARSGRQF